MRDPPLAAVLTAIVPGIGQLYQVQVAGPSTRNLEYQHKGLVCRIGSLICFFYFPFYLCC